MAETKSKKPKIRTSSSTTPAAASSAKKMKKLKEMKDVDKESEPHVLLVDSEDDEIEFKTPPHSVRKLKSHAKTAPVSRILEKNTSRLSSTKKKRMSATPKRLKPQ